MQVGSEKKVDHSARQTEIAALTPYARNSRTHSRKQIKEIAAAIAQFGFTNPVLIDADGGIIAGHGRIMAAKTLGIKQVPTITISGLTEAEKAELVISDNQIALGAEWDVDKLVVELNAVKASSVDIRITGFDDAYLNALLGITPDEDDPDAASDSKGKAGNMAAKFGIPPFSVIDTTDEDWVERREALMKDLPLPDGEDPVFAEQMLSWFAPPGSAIATNVPVVATVAKAAGLSAPATGPVDFAFHNGLKGLPGALKRLSNDAFAVVTAIGRRDLPPTPQTAFYNEIVLATGVDAATHYRLAFVLLKGDAKAATRRVTGIDTLADPLEGLGEAL